MAGGAEICVGALYAAFVGSVIDDYSEVVQNVLSLNCRGVFLLLRSDRVKWLSHECHFTE